MSDTPARLGMWDTILVFLEALTVNLQPPHSFNFQIFQLPDCWAHRWSLSPPKMPWVLQITLQEGEGSRAP